MKSSTKTKTRKRKSDTLHDHGGLIGITRWSTSNKTPKTAKLLKAIGSTATYDSVATFNVVSGILGSTLVLQNVSEICRLWGSPDIKVLWNKAYAANSGWASLQPGLTAAQRTGRLFLKSARLAFEWTNMEPASNVCTLYVLRCKQNEDTNVTSVDRWEQGIDATSGLAGISNTTGLFPGAKPNKLQGFNQWYTIVHSKTWGMNPGETKRHEINININKFINWKQLEDGPNSLRGYTYRFLMVARGTPADDKNDQTVGTIYFAPTKLVGVFTTTYQSKWFPLAPDVTYQTSAMSAVTPSALYTMSDDAGVSVNVLTAPTG